MDLRTLVGRLRKRTVIQLGALFVFVTGGLLLPASALAQAGPRSLNISGGLFNANGTAMAVSGVNFKIEVRDKSGSCVLYSEMHNGEDLTGSKGQFSLLLGSGSSAQNFLNGTSAMDASVYLNRGPTGAFTGCPSGVTLNSGDERVFRVYYDTGGGLVAMTPDVPVVASAYTMIAETLQGKTPSDFIQVKDDGSTASLNQTNTEYAFSFANWPKLKALIDGTSSAYLPMGGTAPFDFNNQRLIRVANPGTSPFDAANKGYVDSNIGGRTADFTGVGPAVGDGKTMVWDQASQKWVVGNPAITGVAGGDLSGTYPNPVIAANAVTTGKVADNAITAAKVNTTGIAINRLVATDGVSGTTLTYFTCLPGEIMWWTTNGWQCTTVAAQAPVKTVAGKTPNASGDVPLNAADITGLGTVVTKDFGSAAGQVPLLDASAKLPAYMLPAGTGTITAVSVVAPMLGGGTSGNVTISLDVGTAANQVVRLNGSAQLPAVDGSLLTGVNATKIGTRAVSSTAPGAAQVLAFNATSSQWEPMTAAVGSVTAVASGTGLVAGTITSTGTINVDVGTTAGKIVQFDASARYPANDGSQITNVNATKIGTRTVATTAPSGNQVLAFNATSAQWEPMTDAGGSVTSVVGGSGLLGGTITSAGTLAVDTGTGANQILKLNGSAQIPAVDGSLLTGVNASKIGTRTVSSAAPSGSQVLAYNASSSQWEPMTDAGGSVVSVVSGTGLVAGTITTNGTINVDVGTGANKIVQLNGSGAFAAIDAGNLYNVNASKIGTRTVSSAAPAGSQVLGYNASLLQWEPMSAAVGSVTTVVSGTGLVAGTITSSGTINVDVGTTSGKIVQFDASARYPGNDGSLITNVNASKIGTRAVSSAAPSGSQVLAYNATSSQWEPTTDAGGSVVSVVSGTGLIAGTITSSGTINVDVGTTSGKIVQFDVLARYPGNDGSLITNVNATKIGTRTVSSAAPSGSQVLAYNATSAQWEPTTDAGGSVVSVVSGTGLIAGTITTNGTINVDIGTGANKVVQLNGSGAFAAIDAGNLYNVNATKLATRAVSNAAPSGSQVLGYNASLSQWEPMSAAVGSVTTVVSGTGLVAGTITSSGTINVDVGTGVNKVVQFDGSARYPANDGSLITNVNATKLATRAVSSAAPSGSQVLAYNASLSQWEPMSATAVGAVTQVTGGSGLLGGTITSSGTLAVDTGTGANQIVKLNGSAQIPAVDGSLLTGVNATKIGTRTVSSAAPVGSQVLGYNASLSQWEPMSAAVGSVTTVTSGTGLVAGTITSSGTINVDVGTGANKIVQFDASARYPANDGSLITNVNATKIGTRAVSSAAPAGAQVLAYNATSSQWEPATASTGSVMSVVSGTGLVAGTITTNGTINVDVGTGANKIVQLNGSAAFPAIDAGNLYNVNATKIGTRAVSSAAPTGSQVLGYNASLSQWEPMSGAVGSVTSVVAGTGLVAGTITSSGTLNVDVGSAAGKIVQENASAQIAQQLGSSATPAYSFAGDTDTGMYASGVNQLTFATAGTAGMTLMADAQLAVTNDLTVFENRSKDATINVTNVSPNYAAGLVLSAQGLYTNVTNQGTFGGVTTVWTSGMSGSTQYAVRGTGSAPFVIEKDAPDSTLYLRQSGNVGVGTNTPRVALEVSATGTNSAILVPRDTTANRPSTNAANGMIRYNTSTGRFEAYEAGAWTNMTASGAGSGDFKSDGSVAMTGQLKAAPGADTAPGITFSNDTNTGFYSAAGDYIGVSAGGAGMATFGANSLSSTTVGGGVVNFGSSALSYPAFTFNGNTNAGLHAVSSNKISLVTNSQARLSVDPAGNVGIGTSTPAALLDLSTSGTNSALIVPRDTTAARPATNAANGMIRYNTSTNRFEAYEAGAWTNMIASGGGTTSFPLLASPGTTLASAPSYSFSGSPDTGLLSQAAGTLALATTGTARLTIINAGNVGIGTSSPAYPLEVNGNAGVSGYIYASRYYAPSLVGGTAASNSLSIESTTSSTKGTIVLAPNGGNVGVGSAAPVAILDVASSGTNSALVVPRDNTANRPAGNVANGMLRYNTSTNKFEAYENGAWVNMIAAGGGTTAFPLLASPGTTPSTAPSYSFTGSTNTGLLSQASGTLALATTGTSRLTVDSAGNVGIGTTAPELPLSVVGNESYGLIEAIGAASNSASSIGLRSSNIARGATGNWILSNAGGSNGNFSIYTPGPGQVLTATTSGLVGIGASSPSANLHVRGTAASNPVSLFLDNAGSGVSAHSVLYVSSANGNAYQVFQDGINWSLGVDRFDSDKFKIGSAVTPGPGNGDMLTLTKSGSLGIGTTSPSAILEVTATGTNSAIIVPRDTTANRPSTNVANGMMRYNSSTNKFEAYENGAWVNMIAAGGGTTAFPLLASPGTTPSTAPSYSFTGSTNTGLYSPASNALALATSGTSRINVLATGNVGVGVVAPNKTLEVGGTGLRVTGSVDENPTGVDRIDFGITNGNARIILEDDAKSATWQLYNDIGTLRLLSTHAGTDIALYPSGAERMRLAVNGNVGIGTSTPAALLDLSTTGTNSALILPRDTTANRPAGNVANGMLRYNTSTNKFEAYENGAWTNMISAGGGTTAFPLLASPGTTPSTAPSYSFAGSTNTGLYSQATNTVSLATAGTARLAIDAIGNVAMSNRLNLANGASLYGHTGYANNLVIEPSNANVGSTVIVRPNGTGNGGGVSIWGNSSDGTGDQFLLLNGSGGGVLGFQYLSKTIDINQGGLPAIRIATNSNVGIGSTSPIAVLDVAATGTNSALVVPRDSTANRPSTNVANGMLRYNTSTSKFEAYENGAWTNMIGGGAASFPLLASPGTTPASAPSYSFTGSTNTGLFSQATNTVSLATAGTARMTIDASGNVGIGVSSPTRPLDIASTRSDAPSSDARVVASVVTWAPSANNGNYIDAPALYGGSTYTSNNSFAGSLNGVQGVSTNLSSTANINIVAGVTGTGESFSANANWVVGVYGRSNNFNSSGQTNNAVGVVGSVDNYGTATISNAYGLYSRVTNDSTGSIATGAGLYIDTIGGNNAFGVYQYNSTNRNYFAGLVGIGATSPKAALDIGITGTNSALIVPRDTTANRPAGNVANGMLRYNTSTAKFEAYEAGAWTNLIGGGGAPTFPLLASPGTTPASAPSYSFTGSPSTGLFSPSTDSVSLATAGVTRMNIDSAGKVTINGAFTNGGVYPLTLTANTGLGAGKYLNLVMDNQTSGGWKSGIEFRNNGAGKMGLGVDTNGNGTNDFSLYDAVAGQTRFLVDPSGRFGVGTSVPQAIMDIAATGTNSALIVPRDTTANRPAANVANGMLRYNTSTNKFEAYENGAWANMIGGGGASTIDALTDARTTGGTDAMYIGAGVGASSSAAENTGVGGLAMQALTTGTENTAVGAQAMKATTTGSYNTALGAYALASNQSGDQNTALGDDALSSMTSGGNNVAIGTNAMIQTTYGDRNVVIGAQTVQGVTSNIYDNVIMGYAAGTQMSTSQGNVILGANAGTSSISGTNFNILVGYNAQAPTTNSTYALNIGNTIFGDLSSKRVNVGSKTLTAGAALEITSQGTIGSTLLVPRDTTANRPGTGVNGMLRYNTSLAKFEAFENGAWTNMIGGGGSSQWTTSGSDIYYNGGKVAIGGTPVAPNKLYVAETRTDTATGYTQSIFGNTTFSPSSASSAQLFNGYFANTFTGATNSPSAEVHGLAGDATMNGTGTVGMLIGVEGLPYTNSGTVNSARSFDGYMSVNGGTTAEYRGLSIAGYVNSGTLQNSYGVFIDDLPGTTQWAFYQAGATDNNYFAGKLGIGVLPSTYALEVNGTAKATSFLSPSDARLKENVQTMSGLTTVRKMRGVSFAWKETGEEDTGVIAQELETVLPFLVATDPKTGFKAVKYTSLISPLIEATKELDVRCEATQAQLDTLERRVASVVEDVEKLKTDNAKLRDENEALKRRLEKIERALNIGQ